MKTDYCTAVAQHSSFCLQMLGMASTDASLHIASDCNLSHVVCSVSSLTLIIASWVLSCSSLKDCGRMETLSLFLMQPQECKSRGVSLGDYGSHFIGPSKLAHSLGVVASGKEVTVQWYCDRVPSELNRMSATSVSCCSCVKKQFQHVWMGLDSLFSVKKSGINFGNTWSTEDVQFQRVALMLGYYQVVLMFACSLTHLREMCFITKDKFSKEAFIFIVAV